MIENFHGIIGAVIGMTGSVWTLVFILFLATFI
jgi:hypothetical protein